MRNREEIIKGLECHKKSGECGEDCPYSGDNNWDCSEWLCEDAYALLSRQMQEQEPRVMTLEEVKKLRSLYDGAVWLEALNGLFPALPEFSTPDITFFVAIPLNNYRGYFDNQYYGKTWRCWTARPTTEQRKAVKWDE